MNYIVMALRCEAQPFVEQYKLHKQKLGDFVFFSHSTFCIIISGVGVQRSRLATQTLINHFDLDDEDSFYNIGICGASRSFELGACVEIGAIEYDGIVEQIGDVGERICCVDEPLSQENGCVLVDMESFGFYDAVRHNPAIKKFAILKVVSDHFEPSRVDKEHCKQSVLHAIEQLKDKMCV